jgi:hypothetical protein
LAGNEKLVELQNNSMSLSSVFTDNIPDPAIVDRFNLNISIASEIIPATFLVNKGNLIPYKCSYVGSNEIKEFGNIDSRFLKS